MHNACRMKTIQAKEDPSHDSLNDPILPFNSFRQVLYLPENHCFYLTRKLIIIEDGNRGHRLIYKGEVECKSQTNKAQSNGQKIIDEMIRYYNHLPLLNTQPRNI